MADVGIGVVFDSNAADLGGAFRNLFEKQFRFAATVALTRLAQDVKKAEIEDLPQRLKVHGKRLANGMRVKRAEVRDWPNATSEVGSLDEFLILQEFGGTKRPTKGASHVAIPARYVAQRRKASTGRFPTILKPRNIPKSHKQPGQAIRAPVRAKGGGQADRVFWFLRESVQIKPRLKFRETARRTAGMNYQQHFERELQAAIKSAKVRATKFSAEQGRFFYRKALASL